MDLSIIDYISLIIKGGGNEKVVLSVEEYLQSSPMMFDYIWTYFILFSMNSIIASAL